MAEISASLVKALRERTGAGMMDCKAALAEAKGDVEAAIDWLRKKGLAKAAKKAGRIAAQGLVGVLVEGNRGVVVELNSETDFVARNSEFQDLAQSIAKIALQVGGDVERIKQAPFPGGGTVADRITGFIAKVGENVSLRRAATLSVGQGALAHYVHGQVAPGLGKIGVVVALESAGRPEELAALGKLVAMHVAAASPLALDSSSLDPALVAREREILAEKAKASGKPAQVIEKIVESGLKTYFKDVTLLDQPYVHEPSKSVAQALKEAEARVGKPVRLVGFIRFALGEGIEKEESDFAAEVAKAAGHS